MKSNNFIHVIIVTIFILMDLLQISFETDYCLDIIPE